MTENSTNHKAASDRAQSVLQLMLLIIRTAHKLNAIGKTVGAVSGSGGTWGVLNSLVKEGAQTVPQIARSRPVARQHVQTLANELEDQGYIRFVENPEHRRSKLMQVTDAGKAYHRAIETKLHEIASGIGQGVKDNDVLAAKDTLSKISQELDDILSEKKP